MMAAKDMYELVADDLAQWIEDTADAIAGMMTDGSHAPFSARVTEGQKLAYYRGTLFNADGTPNVQARQQLLDRAGVKGYAAVLQALGKEKPGLADHPLQATFADQALQED